MELEVIRRRGLTKYSRKIKVISPGGAPISSYRSQFCSAHGTVFLRRVSSTYSVSSYSYGPDGLSHRPVLSMPFSLFSQLVSNWIIALFSHPIGRSIIPIIYCCTKPYTINFFTFFVSIVSLSETWSDWSYHYNYVSVESTVKWFLFGFHLFTFLSTS